VSGITEKGKGGPLEMAPSDYALVEGLLGFA
jgi:hypothetical protein